MAYPLDFDGQAANGSRFWWPIAEAIGAVAALITLGKMPEDEIWYRKRWTYASATFLNHKHGGWFPAVAENGNVVTSIFDGKPDNYHSLQACLFPLS